MMDINKLRELASKADEGYSGTHPRDSNNWEANRDFCCAFTPKTALALLDVAEKAKAHVRSIDCLQNTPVGEFTGEEVPAMEASEAALRTSLAALGEQGK
jgi:hypothetical protein